MTISPALAAVGHVTVAPTPRWAQFAKFASIIPRCRGDVRRRAGTAIRRRPLHRGHLSRPVIRHCSSSSGGFARISSQS